MLSITLLPSYRSVTIACTTNDKVFSTTRLSIRRDIKLFHTGRISRAQPE